MSQLNSSTGTGAPRAPLTPPMSADAQDTAALLEQMAELAPQPETLTTKLAAIGLLDAVEIAAVIRDAQAEWRGVLVEQHGFPSEAVQRAQARALGLPFVDPCTFQIEREAINAVPATVAREHKLIPLCFAAGGLIVAVAETDDAAAREALTFHTQHPVDFVLAEADNIERAITSWYGPVDDRDALDELTEIYHLDHESQAGLVDAKSAAGEKPVVRLVHNLLLDAIHMRASDVHIRPLEDRVDLLFRLDGALVKMRSFAKSMLPAVVSRIKIIGNMDIAEHRLPQDGRFRIRRDGDDIDLRLSIIPMVQGESVVIRILNANAGLKSISELGFNRHDEARFTELMNRSNGMVLVTGPTGCGKSTTLYAALQEVRHRDVNIITVEEPVEYRLAGINQIQVNTATGFTFARALRHILRHDPDVVMVGEIRDPETAKMAVESSLTGHLVLSTLHTNDAASAVTRLLEIGVEPYLVRSSLAAVLAQRLVRKNCDFCIEPEPLEPQVRAALAVDDDEVFCRGAGCPKCHGTGYSGRRSVYELLTVTDELRDLIDDGVSAGEIERTAIAAGMEPLTHNALKIARTGETSLAEVYRVRLT